MMKYILDANTLIYLIKENLHEKFIELSKNHEILIGLSVYNETVENGIKNSYPDALIIRKWLQMNKIPIIPIDVSDELHKYRNPGETSCSILVNEDIDGSICITSDGKAINKFQINNIPHSRLDTLYYKFFMDLKINSRELFEILNKLETIYATTPERILYFNELIQNNLELKEKDRNE